MAPLCLKLDVFLFCSFLQHHCRVEVERPILPRRHTRHLDSRSDHRLPGRQVSRSRTVDVCWRFFLLLKFQCWRWRNLAFMISCFRAGMLPGDVVVEINGAKVNTSEEIYQAVRSSDKIAMVVQRGKELLRLQMTPESTEWH